MIYHVQWRRPGGSWKWLTGWGLMEDRDLPAEDARKMTRSEAEAAVRNLTSGPKNVRGEDIQYEARVVPQGGSGSPTRGRGAGLFVVRSNSGKVVGRYHTKAEAEHRVQQLKAGAARLRPFQFHGGVFIVSQPAAFKDVAERAQCVIEVDGFKLFREPLAPNLALRLGNFHQLQGVQARP